MSDLLVQVQCDELVSDEPTTEDWADYCEYLDSIGYDSDDDTDEGADPDGDRGFQPWHGDCPF